MSENGQIKFNHDFDVKEEPTLTKILKIYLKEKYYAIIGYNTWT